MKKQFTIFSIIFFLLGVAPINFSNAQNLSEKLSGKILLQVESVGQAWYIDPETSERAFLGRPADAFRIMRELGLGISEKDYNSFAGYVPSRLSGKILLRVEAKGEAYYVFPDDLKMYYLGRPADAFSLMREKGLGITNDDLNKVPVFQKYKEQVEKNTQTIEQNSEAINKLAEQLNEQSETIAEQEEKITQLKEQQTETPDEKDFTPIEEVKTAAYIEVSTDNDTIASDGHSRLKIYVTVKDSDLNPINNKDVKFSISSNLSTESKTNNLGVATSEYISSGVNGLKTIIVSVDDLTKIIQIEEINYPNILEFDVNPSDNGVSFGLKVDKDYIFKITLDNGMYTERNIKDKYISANTRIGTGIGYSSDKSKNPVSDTEYSYILEVTDKDGNVTTQTGSFRTLKWGNSDIMIEPLDNVIFSYGDSDPVTAEKQLILSSNIGDTVSIKIIITDGYNNVLPYILPVKINSTELSTDGNGTITYSYSSEATLNDTILEIRCPISSDDDLFQRLKKVKIKILE